MKKKDNPVVAEAEGFTLRRREFLGMLTGVAAVATMAGPSALMAKVMDNGGILRVGAPANPSSMDPATGGSGSDHVFLFPVFATLVEWDYDTLKAEPGLAKSWEYPDSKTLVLNIREGVKFHDGTELDAEAVKFNLDRSRTDPRSNIRSDLASVEKVEVTAPHEVTVHLKSPDTSLPLVLSDRAGMMVSPSSIKKFGEESDRNPVGAGHMKFVEWNDGDRIILERNPDYWNKERPLLDGINFRIITDSSTRLRSVMSGQNDVAYQLEGRQKPLIERGGSVEGVYGATVYCFQIYLNHASGPLSNVKVRQALNYAINREALVRASMHGAGEPAYMNLPSSHWAYDADVAELYSYDPDKARKLLAEAGYPDGIELDMRGYNDQGSVQRQEILQGMLADVGIRGTFKTGTVPDMSAAYFARGEGDFLVSAWTGRPDPSLTYALLYAGDSYFNAGKVEPPEGLMEAIRASRSTADLEERKKAFSTVQRIVMENALVVPLAFREDIMAAVPKVENLQTNLLGKPKFKHVYLES
ncbi:peptide/nickel transport system permease protein/peptide/nickel transport system substrate-binding protein [Marinobacter daqiaonensis]|uniref:Peptide/nickel transport system permease protein/peptide/nickel transport system substrate-binding protein n=1 Tax=Marinobacter daqiaonensis TaxID=650891 RepID=A0A1I6H109_9GAMM|nr:ABC transporter substrate-binding protein [Marinobacter daqiaonensis]SFR48011.1 peptide/nickel transport system permease protein/peptide/nickel transport system substrate-binding protein [Marinobacter daqiaonensis]